MLRQQPDEISKESCFKCKIKTQNLRYCYGLLKPGTYHAQTPNDGTNGVPNVYKYGFYCLECEPYPVLKDRHSRES